MCNLKKIRKDKGVKQSEVARYLGVSEATYSRYENYGIQMNLETIVKLISFFKVSADYFLGIIDEEKADENNRIKDVSKSIDFKVANLNEVDLQKVLKILHILNINI